MDVTGRCITSCGDTAWMGTRSSHHPLTQSDLTRRRFHRNVRASFVLRFIGRDDPAPTSNEIMDGWRNYTNVCKPLETSFIEPCADHAKDSD